MVEPTINQAIAQEEDIVTAWDIQATSEKGIDYAKLIDKYGCFPISQE